MATQHNHRELEGFYVGDIAVVVAYSRDKRSVHFVAELRADGTRETMDDVKSRATQFMKRRENATEKTSEARRDALGTAFVEPRLDPHSPGTDEG